MSSSWSALHAQLRRSSERLCFHRRYRTLRARHAVLRDHPDPQALLGDLHAPRGDPDRKNRVLLALLKEAGEEADETAATLLILALWPGLDAVRGRLLRHFKGRVAGLDAELVGRLSLGIRGAGAANIGRVAATLLRNVERDITRNLVRAARQQRLQEEHLFDLELLLSVSGEVDDVDHLSAAVCHELGRDGPLVVAIVLDGLSQNEAAERLGLSHDAARKRYQRVLRTLNARAQSGTPR